MELKNIIKPQPVRQYTGMELSRAFRIALHNLGIKDEPALRGAIFKKVTEWNPKSSINDRLAQASRLRTELNRQTLGWKTFCKAAAVLNLDTDVMLQVIA